MKKKRRGGGVKKKLGGQEKEGGGSKKRGALWNIYSRARKAAEKNVTTPTQGLRRLTSCIPEWRSEARPMSCSVFTSPNDIGGGLLCDMMWHPGFRSLWSFCSRLLNWLRNRKFVRAAPITFLHSCCRGVSMHPCDQASTLPFTGDSFTCRTRYVMLCLQHPDIPSQSATSGTWEQANPSHREPRSHWQSGQRCAHHLSFAL